MRRSSKIRRWLAELIDPSLARDEREYVRVMNNLAEVHRRCSYAYPSARVIVDWIVQPHSSTGEQLTELLERENSGAEPEELRDRIDRALRED